MCENVRKKHTVFASGLTLVHARRREMYKQYLERYNGNLNAIVEDVVRYAVESTGEINSLDGSPVNVLFDLSISTDDDVPPKDAYFWRVDEVQTQTRWLFADTIDAIVTQLKVQLARVVKIGDLVSFSINTWKEKEK